MAAARWFKIVPALVALSFVILAVMLVGWFHHTMLNDPFDDR